MKPENFTALRTAICKRFPWPDMVAIARRYRARELSYTRFRWDMLHASGFNTANLYSAGLNDAHIDTALRTIMPDHLLAD